MDRRLFVQHSAVAAIGATGWMSGLRDLIEYSRRQDRPVLTETSLNAFVRDLRARGSTAMQQFVDVLRADMPRAVRDRFTLTTAQDQRLGTFTATQKTTIVTAFERGFTGRNELVVAMTDQRYAGRCRVSAVRTLKQLDGGRAAELWTLTFSE